MNIVFSNPIYIEADVGAGFIIIDILILKSGLIFQQWL